MTKESKKLKLEGNKRGGQNLILRKGKEHMVNIGKSGGMKTKSRGSEYYREIALKGLKKRWGK